VDDRDVSASDYSCCCHCTLHVSRLKL
jgi:hypothetical protein